MVVGSFELAVGRLGESGRLAVYNWQFTVRGGRLAATLGRSPIYNLRSAAYFGSQFGFAVCVLVCVQFAVDSLEFAIYCSRLPRAATGWQFCNSQFRVCVLIWLLSWVCSLRLHQELPASPDCQLSVVSANWRLPIANY